MKVYVLIKFDVPNREKDVRGVYVTAEVAKDRCPVSASDASWRTDVNGQWVLGRPAPRALTFNGFEVWYRIEEHEVQE